MMSFKAALIASSIVVIHAIGDTDSVILLQGQITQKTAGNVETAADNAEPSSYNLPHSPVCEGQEAVKPRILASAMKPATPAASFAQHIKPLRLTPEAESGDPAGADTLRAFLELAVVAIIFDSGRRLMLRKKEASQQKDAQPVKIANSDADAAWLELVTAASEADLCKFEKALQRSPSVKRSDTWGCTALHFAAAGGSTEIATELLKRGADVDAPDANEETPLHFAARAGHTSICEMLLDAGAKMDTVSSQELTPFVLAGQANQEAACRLLADRGARVAGMADETLPLLVVSQLLEKLFAA